MPAELVFSCTSCTVLHVSVASRIGRQVEARSDGSYWVEARWLTVLGRWLLRRSPQCPRTTLLLPFILVAEVFSAAHPFSLALQVVKCDGRRHSNGLNPLSCHSMGTDHGLWIIIRRLHISECACGSLTRMLISLLPGATSAWLLCTTTRKCGNLYDWTGHRGRHGLSNLVNC